MRAVALGRGRPTGGAVCVQRGNLNIPLNASFCSLAKRSQQNEERIDTNAFDLHILKFVHCH